MAMPSQVCVAKSSSPFENPQPFHHQALPFAHTGRQDLIAKLKDTARVIFYLQLPSVAIQWRLVTHHGPLGPRH